MQIYQFIKYDQETTVNHLLKRTETGAVLCFDFEDSVQNPIDPIKTIEVKKTYRKYFRNLVVNNLAILINLKLGVRLNFSDANELNRDIEAIESLDLHSIFLPKVENQEELVDTVNRINAANITYSEIIPVIESRKGIDNLSEIIKINTFKIKHVAFGHCDYNLSLNIFPFFHQDSNEYWKWVDKIISITASQNINFINSPYLKVDDDIFFSLMLNHLANISNNNFGQITLSNRQSQLCLTYSKNNVAINKIIHNRHDLYVPDNYPEKLISDFKAHNIGKGFTKFDNEIISYQEYIGAKTYIQSHWKRVIRLAIVGGCFPVQHNILFEDHFHQLLKQKIEKEKGIEVRTNIIRYERLSSVLGKIKTLNNQRQIDTLIFSIRPEPYLRLIKLFYKYIDNSGKLKRSLNLPLFNILSSEKYDILTLGRIFDYSSKTKNSFFHKSFVDGNYLFGKLIGNQKYALTKYLGLVKEVINYCCDNKIKLILLGPNLRSNTKYEPGLCKDLDKFIRKSIKDTDYINGLETLSPSGKPLFNENGIHVNEKYHQLIAERLFNALETTNSL